MVRTFDIGQDPIWGHGDLTLSSLAQATFVDGKQLSRKEVSKRAAKNKAQVIVMEHMHQPDEHVLSTGGCYYNPRSWTRYLELALGRMVTRNDLCDERQYSYRSNVVRSDAAPAGLVSTTFCVDACPAAA